MVGISNISGAYEIFGDIQTSLCVLHFHATCAKTTMPRSNTCPYCFRQIKNNLNRHLPKCPENNVVASNRHSVYGHHDPFINSRIEFSKKSRNRNKRTKNNNHSFLTSNKATDWGDLSILSTACSKKNQRVHEENVRQIQYSGNLHATLHPPEDFCLGTSTTNEEGDLPQNLLEQNSPPAQQRRTNTGVSTRNEEITPMLGTYSTINESVEVALDTGTSSDNETFPIPEENIIPGNIHIQPNDDRFKIIAQKNAIAYTRIFDVLNQCKVPHYGYDAIIKTISQEVIKGTFNPCDRKVSRKSYLKYIKKRFPTAKPLPVIVRLENRWNLNENAGTIRQCDSVEVITFDFKDQLEDLLSDQTLFGDLDNLVINKNHDPGSKWLPYNNIEGTMYEVLDGHWYQQYGRNCVKDATKEFCFPIGLYIDASETVTYGRYSFQPLIMFPLVLNLKTRNRNTASRVIALIPDLDAKSSAVKAANRAGGKANIGTSMRNYHQCMDVALNSLKTYQKQGGIIT